MSPKHSFFAAVACALPLSFAACGSSNNNNDSPIIPEGPHYGFVVSQASIPTTNQQFALDLGSKTSSKPDGTIDNALGGVLGTLKRLNFDVQGTVTKAVDQGTILLLIDLQTEDLKNSSAAGFSVKFGAMPQPPACNPAGGDTVCRRHLDGQGSFQIATDSPTDSGVAGKIVNGAFTGGPGAVTLQIAIGSTVPINLNLVHARVQGTIDATNSTLTATIGGLVTQTELNTQIGPALQQQVLAIFSAQCTAGATCDCPADSQAALLLGLGIEPDNSCMVTVDQVLNSPAVKTELQPDSCSMDSCTTPDSISLGVQVQAVKAAFPGVM